MYVVPYAHLDTQWRWEMPKTISECATALRHFESNGAARRCVLANRFFKIAWVDSVALILDKVVPRPGMAK